MNKLEKIRFHYFIYQDIIREAYPQCLCHGYDVKSEKSLTPIEIGVYETIQYYNLPLLPQYPINNYFVDFGDPIRKIAIEVDGKYFHLDKRKDEVRQKEIEAEGWTFYRIQGKHTYFPIYEYYKYLTKSEMEYASNEELDEFIDKHKNSNSDCLITYLNKTIYDSDPVDEDMIPNMVPISESLKKVEKDLIQITKRRIEWEEKYGEIDK